MKKVFLGLLLVASAVMADVSTNQDDLLSVATAGKTTGTQFEMDKEQMKDADGGWSFVSISYSNYFYSYWYNRLSSSYR